VNKKLKKEEDIVGNIFNIWIIVCGVVILLKVTKIHVVGKPLKIVLRVVWEWEPSTSVTPWSSTDKVCSLL
jgi:hypothetical protein